MSGHSRWSQIKHQKGITDKKKGQLFSKLSKLISLAAKKGADPASNLELKNAIEQARSFNVPSGNIEKAIKKVSDKSAVQIEELSIEAIGPGGIALRIKAITDNRNRTISEIKNILNEHGSKMVPPGSISWMFTPNEVAVPRSSGLATESRARLRTGFKQPISVENPDIQTQIDKLFEALDGNEDVEDVVSNLQ